MNAERDPVLEALFQQQQPTFNRQSFLEEFDRRLKRELRLQKIRLTLLSVLCLIVASGLVLLGSESVQRLNVMLAGWLSSPWLNVLLALAMLVVLSRNALMRQQFREILSGLF